MDQMGLDQIEVSTERPKLEFEPGSFTLSEIVDSYLLPMVVQLDNQKHPLPFKEFNFDLSQPLVLYKKRNIQKVPAVSVTIDGDQYVDVGESLLIPEDYKGWFAVLQRWGGNMKADDNVPHFKTVEELANSNTDKFLIGGTSRITGLHVIERSDSHLNHEQRYFMPGDIFIRDKVYFGETKKRTRLFRKPKYITEKFLQCRDEADREILLPFEQKGIFYQVSERSGKPNHNVMQMSDVVARNLPPRIIKLVFGRFPVTPCSFTGLMKADTARLESSIIASTIVNKKNILLEIPMTADMYFKVVTLTDELKNDDCYKNAMSLCMERATTYMRNIKVCYNFTCKDDEHIQTIKKESDMDLISSDEGNDGNLSPRDLKTKKSSSLKRKFRKTKSLERNNKPLGQNEKKSSPKRSGSKKGQSKQSQSPVLGNDVNDNFSEVDMRVAGSNHTRFSHEIEEAANATFMRPGRALSTGRMSFCFGNSYLTVPIFATGLSALNEDRNKSCDDLNEIKDELSNAEVDESLPPPMPCTDIGSYVNTGEDSFGGLGVEHDQHRRTSDIIYNANFGQYVNDPEIDSGFHNNGSKDQSSNSVSGTSESNDTPEKIPGTDKDCLLDESEVQEEPECDNYVPVSHARRPSSKPPESAPPPVPSHPVSTSSRESSSSTSDESVSDDRRSSRASAERLQYDTPKPKEENALSPNLAFGDSKLPTSRRPSTFTFTEGLCSLPHGETSNILDDGLPGVTEDSPIYENIQALQELMETMENLEIEDADIMDIHFKHQTDTESNYLDTNKGSVVFENTNKGTEAADNVNTGLSLSINDAESAEVEGEIDLAESPVTGNPLSENVPMKLAKTLSLDSNTSVSSKISKQNSLTEKQKSIDELTVDEFIAQLEQIGIRDNSLNRVKELKIDGKLLSSVAHDDECLKECLPDVSLIDMQKITMFLRGWRPHEES